jgi:hypothetical protein
MGLMEIDPSFGPADGHAEDGDAAGDPVTHVRKSICINRLCRGIDFGRNGVVAPGGSGA